MIPRATSLLLVLCLAPLANAEPVKHNYDLQHVLWRLSFDMAKETIAGDVTNRLTLSENSATVELHCSKLAVTKVTVNGKPAAFSTKNDKLAVTIPGGGKVGQTLAVRTIYTGSPQIGFYFVPASRAFPAKNNAVYTQGQGEDNRYWLPTYDLPDDKATSECYVQAPAGWITLSNGALKAVRAKGKEKVHHWLMEQPHSTYLISLVAGEFIEVKDKWRTIPVNYLVPPGLERAGKASFAETPKMVDFFSKLTGVDYPFAKFSQVPVADFLYGGMENTTAVTLTLSTLHKPESEPVRDSSGLVLHELAHQWFGDLITCRTWEHSWLNEGFASALPLFYYRQTRGQDDYDIQRYQNFEGAINSIGSRGRKEVDAATGSSKSVNVGSVYDGGCSRILMLMRAMGEETFWKAIKQYLTDFGFKPSTTGDFFSVMAKVSGVDWSAFERQWFYTPATPSITASIVGQDLVIRQLRPYYALELPVWILSNGSWIKQVVRLDGEEASLALGEHASKPLLVDPEVWTLTELKYDIKYTEQQVAALYRAAPNAAQRARIIAGMFDALPVKTRIAIGHGETHWALLQMIAGKIGQEGAWYLLELTNHPDKRVVNTAVNQIGGLGMEPALATRLGEIARKDPNETVRESAMRALLGWTDDPALAKEAWALRSFHDGFRRMALEWWGRKQPNLAREKCLAILAKPDSEPLRQTACEVLGRVKEGPGGTAVFVALAKVAREKSYHTRTAAIRALGELGNKAAIPILQPITEHGPWGPRGAATEAIEKLKKS